MEFRTTGGAILNTHPLSLGPQNPSLISRRKVKVTTGANGLSSWLQSVLFSKAWSIHRRRISAHIKPVSVLRFSLLLPSNSCLIPRNATSADYLCAYSRSLVGVAKYVVTLDPLIALTIHHVCDVGGRRKTASLRRRAGSARQTRTAPEI